MRSQELKHFTALTDRLLTVSKETLDAASRRTRTGCAESEQARPEAEGGEKAMNSLIALGSGLAWRSRFQSCTTPERKGRQFRARRSGACSSA